MKDQYGTDAATLIAWDMINKMNVNFMTLPEEDKKVLIERAAKDAACIVAEVKEHLSKTDSYATEQDLEEVIRSKQAWYKKLPFL